MKSPTRRKATLALAALGVAGGRAAAAPPAVDRAWVDAAFEMRRVAEAWGDQPYGAVLVLGGVIVGFGPSRVVQRGDAAAHAEREALADARRRLGRDRLDGSVLVSTSRPCPACERASARAGVVRMHHGRDAVDAGPPKAD
jgi:tRNA(Arg) A34 adenosine deaminase TadA